MPVDERSEQTTLTRFSLDSGEPERRRNRGPRVAGQMAR